MDVSATATHRRRFAADPAGCPPWLAFNRRPRRPTREIAAETRELDLKGAYAAEK